MVNHRATPPVWKRLLGCSWRHYALPGITFIALVVIARMLGLLQVLEWKTLDAFLRLRPPETQDERILIVGIDEADIQQVGTYPIPDRNLADLLQVIAESQPRAIGIDIFRDLPVEPGHQALIEVLAEHPNILGAEKISNVPVFPPHSLPQERVGFIELPLDPDGFVRRAYLGNWPPPNHPESGEFHFSLALRLAETYLIEEGLSLESGLQDSYNMRFGDTELFRFHPNSGGYVRTSADGVQILINPRSGKSPFKVVSMADILEGPVKADLIRDRIVLIGITSLSIKDIVNSAAVNTDNPSLFSGVEMQAHVTSQILSAVLDNRPLLNIWEDSWEYIWIFFWGSVGMVPASCVLRPSRYLLSISLIGLGLVGTSMAALWLWGWWMPVVPTLIGLIVNGWVLPGFYLYDQTLRSSINERQRVIEQTYDAIHNGPLQTLALLLKQPKTLDPHTKTQLTNLNFELREIYQRLQQESLPQEEQLHLGNQRVIDLRSPFHEVLYEVHNETLRREFPGFDSIKVKIVKFEPLQVEGLSADERRSLCRFLEEALCNVGKHAISAKRLTVSCMATEAENLIRVEDNGKGMTPLSDQKIEGRGTQQAQALAYRLHGKFKRSSCETGTYCELRWPVPSSKPWWRG